MSSRIIEIPRGESEESPLGTLIEQFGKLGESALGIVKQFFQLPLSNPTMAAVLGILLNDMLAHKVNWIQWTHEEQFCQSDNVFISIFDTVTGQHIGCQTMTVSMPGVITGAANLQIAAIILTSFGIAEAGAILSDISQLTKLSGGSTSPPPTQPSVTTLGVPIAAEKVTS